MNRVIITVFESELQGKDRLREEINSLCDDVKQIGSAYTYQPSSGKLFEIIRLLKLGGISYGTHFDTLSKIAR